jgi:hypothetical protein
LTVDNGELVINTEAAKPYRPSRIPPLGYVERDGELVRVETPAEVAQKKLIAKLAGVEVDIDDEVVNSAIGGLDIAELGDNEQWRNGVVVQEGKYCIYNGNRYLCKKYHIAQEIYAPSSDNPLFEISPFDWVLPQGLGNAYSVGSMVAQGGQIWVSTVPNNMYVPGEYGWLSIDN